MNAAIAALVLGGISSGIGYAVPTTTAPTTQISFWAWVAVNKGFSIKLSLPAMIVAGVVAYFFGLAAGIIAGLIAWLLAAYSTMPAMDMKK